MLHRCNLTTVLGFRGSPIRTGYLDSNPDRRSVSKAAIDVFHPHILVEMGTSRCDNSDPTVQSLSGLIETVGFSSVKNSRSCAEKTCDGK